MQELLANGGVPLRVAARALPYGAQRQVHARIAKRSRHPGNQSAALIVQDCEFHYFLYEMNSFVSFTKFGGELRITDSLFSHISSCGAVVKNYLSLPSA